MNLKSVEGYYAKEVRIQDATFGIREWTEEFEAVANNVPNQIAAELGIASESLSADSIRQVAAQEGGVERAALADRRMREYYQELLETGLVSWTGIQGPDGPAPITPENIALLPNDVKIELVGEITRMSRMQPAEAGFSKPSSASS